MKFYKLPYLFLSVLLLPLTIGLLPETFLKANGDQSFYRRSSPSSPNSFPPRAPHNPRVSTLCPPPFPPVQVRRNHKQKDTETPGPQTLSLSVPRAVETRPSPQPHRTLQWVGALGARKAHTNVSKLNSFEGGLSQGDSTSGPFGWGMHFKIFFPLRESNN